MRKAIILGAVPLLGLAFVTPQATAAPEVRLVKDIVPGAKGATPQWVAPVGDPLYFGADDGTHGDELWRSDGTQGRDRDGEGHPAGRGWSSPYFLTDVGGTLYFAADDGTHG